MENIEIYYVINDTICGFKVEKFSYDLYNKP